MKRSKQVGWFITSSISTLIAIFFMALLVFAGDEAQSRNSTGGANPAFTANLLTSQISGDSSSRKEDEPSKKPQPIYLMHAASVSGANGDFPSVRRIAPYWERSAPMDKPLLIINFFFPVLSIRFFTLFYRLARTNPGDEPPDYTPFS